MVGAAKPHRGGARSRRRCDGVGGAVGVHQLRWEPAGGIPEPVPLVEIDLADLRVVDEQAVVELGAQPGRGPVGGASPGGWLSNKTAGQTVGSVGD